MSAEVKRQEKLQKKLKPLFEDKLKCKQRLHGLESFLESSNETDEKKVFLAHDQLIYNLVEEYICYKIEKIREKSLPIGSKDVANLFETFTLFEKILKYCYEKINNGWMLIRIHTIFDILLHPGNHQKLRKHGLVLLLQFLESQNPVAIESKQLYAKVVDLSLFPPPDVPDEDGSIYECTGEDETGILGEFLMKDMIKNGEKQHKSFEDLNSGNLDNKLQLIIGVVVPKEGLDLVNHKELLNDILNNIVDIANRISKNLKFKEYTATEFSLLIHDESCLKLNQMWNFFKDAYIRKLFPLINAKLKSQTDILKYDKFCSIELLDVLLQFISKITTTVVHLSENSLPKEVGIGLLQELFLGDEENREFIHEMFRQGFILHQPSIPIHIISCWLTQPDEDTHRFLTSSCISLKDPTPSVVKGNIMLRRYIKYFRISLFGKTLTPEKQFSMFKNIIYFYRFIACETFHKLDQRSWEALMKSLLDIQDQLFINALTSQYTLKSPYLDDIIQLLTETIFIVWIRSDTKNEQMWRNLEISLNQLGEIENYLKQWMAIMIQMTNILTDHSFKLSATDITQKEDHTKAKRINRGKMLATSQQNLLANNQPSNANHSGHSIHVPTNTSATKGPNRLSKIIGDDPENSQESDKTSDDGAADTGYGWSALAENGDFTAIKNLEHWNSFNAMYIWKNLLCCIGKIHEIRNVDVHFQIITCIVNIWDILNKTRQMQPFDNSKAPSLFDFAGILFKAADMPIEYSRSVEIASGCICRMMCKRHDQPEYSKWLGHFYRILIKHLSSPIDATIFSVLSNVSKLYTLALPGSTIVIPTFIKCAYMINLLPNVELQVCKDVIQLLGSLISFEKRYRTKELVVASPETSDLDRPLSYNPDQNAKGVHIFSNLKHGVRDLLQKQLQLNLDLKNYDACETILWMFGMSLFEESLIPDHRRSKILQTDLLTTLLDFISCKELRIAKAANDGLSLLGCEYKRLIIEEAETMVVISRIVLGISEHLSMERKHVEDLRICVTIVSHLFRTLLDWLMNIPSKLVENPNTALRVSEVIEETIHVAVNGVESQMDLIKQRDKAESKEKDEQTAIGSNDMLNLYQSLKDTAQNTLLHLSQHLDNFSPINGPAAINTLIVDPMEEEIDSDMYQYFSSSNSTILTYVDIPSENACRILIRNAAGKFSWKMKQFHHSIDEVERTHSCNCLKVKTPTHGKPLMNDPKKQSMNTLGSINGLLTRESDILEATLQQIQEHYPECQYTIPSIDSTEVDPFKDLVEQQIEEELKSSLAYQDTLAFIDIPRYNSQILTQDRGSFSIPRLLLSHLGQLSFEHLKASGLQLLQKSTNLLRDIKGLDRKSCREVAKFAVVYVGPGQEDEYSIFRNITGSIEYDEFVSSLGWEIDIGEHPGYCGGLDSNMVINGKAVYYCNSTIEMVFHDITKFPTDLTDSKQLKKKRHIGNDHVHIVWNEHYRDYKNGTIGGDFGNAIIVISPLVNGMYTIHTFKDDTVASFGPLQNRSVVTKEALGPMVRATAMNAFRSAICVDGQQGMDVHPFTLRKQNIETISNRHKVSPNTYERYMNDIIHPQKEKEKEPEKEILPEHPIVPAV
ncbi:hypothetical protein BC833DRAFT_602787 [Globomyces pollinis-pini]|nr:hypothetical protein BC833DRAFT_602787 [Globomyces pollinis-pini]